MQRGGTPPGLALEAFLLLPPEKLKQADSITPTLAVSTGIAPRLTLSHPVSHREYARPRLGEVTGPVGGATLAHATLMLLTG